MALAAGGSSSAPPPLPRVYGASGPAALLLGLAAPAAAAALPAGSLLVPDVLVRARSGLPAPAASPALTESCLVRAAFACAGGAVMGGLFGAAMAGLGGGAMAEVTPAGRDVRAMQALREGLAHMRARAVSSGRSFALIGGIYSLVECPIERARGRRDLKNAVATGAITGAVVAYRAGPKAMVLGAAGFAAFGVVMDVFFPNMLDGFGGG